MKRTIPIPYVNEPLISSGMPLNEIHSSSILVKSKANITNKNGTPNNTTNLHPRL